MNLRGFILVIWFGTLVTILGLFYVQSQSILARVFEDVETVYAETTRHTTKAMLQAQGLAIETVRKGLENDNALSSALMTAQEHRRMGSLTEELEKRRTNLDADIFELIYSDGSVRGVARLTPLPDAWKVSLRGESQFRWITLGNRPFLVSFSPLRNFREVVGVVALGYDINRLLAPKIATVTRTHIQFVVPQTDTPWVVEAGSALPPIGVLLTSDYLPTLNASAKRHIIQLGILSLCLVTGLLHVFLEFGFVRRFKRLLSSINEVASNLDRQSEVTTVDLASHPIREIDLLSRVFSKFSESLERYKQRVRERSHTEARVHAAEQVAHDLKSPLSAMEMLLDSPSLESANRISRLRQCVDRMRGTLRLLSSEKRPDRPTTVALTPLISEVIGEKKVQYANRPEVELRHSTSGDDAWVAIDADDLKRVLSNLVDNAYQAIKRSGTIEICFTRGSQKIHLSVRDTGEGIDENVMGQIGQRGFTVNRPNGQGLGIWNAEQVIGAAGGKLQIESAKNRGTSVTLTFPGEPATEEVS